MKSIKIITFITFIFVFSTQAFGFDFQVRVKNRTSANIVVNGVDIDNKGLALSSCEWVETAFQETISAGGETRCTVMGDREKRKRSITVHITCADNSYPSVVVFPRNRNWYSRKHLQNNHSMYTLKIKDSDC